MLVIQAFKRLRQKDRTSEFCLGNLSKPCFEILKRAGDITQYEGPRLSLK